MDSFEHTASPVDADAGPAPADRAAGTTAEQVSTAEQVESRHSRRVACRDVHHAHRMLDVLVDRDRVVLAGPPGGTAVLSAESAGQLSTALRSAADQARK